MKVKFDLGGFAMKPLQVGVFAVAVLLGASCADNQASLLIVQNQVVPDTCVVPASVGTAYNADGLMDVSFVGASGYALTPVVRSGLVNAEKTDNGDIVTLRGANVELLAVNNADSEAVISALAGQNLTQRNRRTSGSVNPGGTAAMSFDAIDPEQADAIRAAMPAGKRVQIVASVVVYGDVEGNYIESKVFDYPITACNGCSIVDVGACAAVTGTPDEICFYPGQDKPIECCTDPTLGTVCPAREIALPMP